ncbi:MltG/YceG/YrrL family protein [Helicovermis profundi]|uniref:Uncharacterized protein n=1 Tax=Helicovermis profundi TaxID=3065157 RepID=A0AAU9E9X6_9FIRM|nr:hypothetical protein HLPR_04000 [Clostridia bacterium S502]
MEKIKDFLYDISDIVVSLLIIAAIFTIVTWKISTSLDLPEISVAQSTNTLVAENNEPASNNKSEENLIDVITVDNTDSSTKDSTKADDSSSETTNISTQNDTEKTNSENLDAKPDMTSDKNTSTESNDTSTNVTTTKAASVVKIHIKSGTSGYGIAKLLKQNGLIDNTTTFIKRVEELKLGVSLRAGDFNLKTDMTLDEMIHTLVGK